jgi:hypothetical protein
MHHHPKSGLFSRFRTRSARRRTLLRARASSRIIPGLDSLEGRVCLSVFYTDTVIAETGRVDQNGDALTGISNDPSINDAGQVAFVGNYSVGQGILVGDGTTLTNINPAFSHTATRTFAPFVEINNKDQVVAVDRVSGSPPLSILRTWDATTTNSSNRILVNAGQTGFPFFDPFDAILSSPAINNNGDVVFPGLSGTLVTLAAQPAGSSRNTFAALATLNAPQALRPQISDSGAAVVQEGNQPTSPIVLFDTVAGTSMTIAAASATSDFSALGHSPGVSADGQIVVFSATVSAQGQTDFGIPAGTNAVFASVSTNGSRTIVPITYATASNGLVSSPITDINLNASVAVNSTQSTQRAVTIAYDGYIGTGANKVEGLYTSRLNFFGNGTAPFDPANPATFTVGVPTQVVQIGDRTIPGLGAVTGFNLFDSVNDRDRGNVAFWATDGTDQAIVRARSQEVVYLDFNPTQTFALDASAAQLFSSRLGNVPAVFAGDFTSILNVRPDLSTSAAISTIELNIKLYTQLAFDAANADVLVLTSATDPMPVNGNFDHVYIGAGGGVGWCPLVVEWDSTDG